MHVRRIDSHRNPAASRTREAGKIPTTSTIFNRLTTNDFRRSGTGQIDWASPPATTAPRHMILKTIIVSKANRSVPRPPEEPPPQPAIHRPTLVSDELAVPRHPMAFSTIHLLSNRRRLQKVTAPAAESARTTTTCQPSVGINKASIAAATNAMTPGRNRQARSGSIISRTKTVQARLRVSNDSPDQKFCSACRTVGTL